MDSSGSVNISVEAQRRIRLFHGSLPVLVVLAISATQSEELRNESYASESG